VRAAPAATAAIRPRPLNRATRLTVATIGTVFALGGVEHGIGEVLQGHVAPAGLLIRSWPHSDAFRVLDGEPAMTVVPSLLVTGVLAVLASLAFLVWATTSLQRRRGGLVLILLAVVMLLLGGGIGPPLMSVLLGLVATRVTAPLTWWRTRVPDAVRRALAALWPWSLGAHLVALLALLPGVVLVSARFGADAVPEALVYALIASGFGSLLLSLAAALASDSRRPCSPPPTPRRGRQWTWGTAWGIGSAAGHGYADETRDARREM
jgi:hypothetical protein